jgi:hypothetical protein
MARTVHVVPHTHWDREWYKPFPVFRLQLVELLDGLLDTLDAEPAYRHFQLDGQMAVIDDYLEIRPAARDRLHRLNRDGRLAMGPWYTLPDEFLVSGETHVRNLRLGLDRAEALGGAMTVGYLPDMFGHVAQMPQILAGFGFTDAVVWRGVPAAIEAPAFWWEAPDGTRVRAEYLADGYGNGARLPADGRGLVDQVAAFRAAQGPRVGDDVLWMHGTDHQLPDPRLLDVLVEADALGGDRFELTSLAHHLRTAPTDGLPTWTGELRSGARSNLLMGVASCRTDVKQAAVRAERWLERIAEPLLACWMPAADWPAEFLAVAWHEVVRNAAHDSICGCSADEVNQAVLHRYAEATRVAEALTDRALIRTLAASGQPLIAVNPSARARSGVVTAVVPGDVAPPDTQQLSVRPAVVTGPTLPAVAAVAVVLRAALEDPRVSAVDLVPDPASPSADAPAPSADAPTRPDAPAGVAGTPAGRHWVARLHADRAPARIDADALRTGLEAVAADPHATVTLETVRRSATQEVLVRTDEVPGFGWRGLAPAPLGDTAVRPHEGGLTNGLVTLTVDQSDGTFAIDGFPGFGRLVSDGDAGDTYNWSPTADGTAIHRPRDVDVLVTEAGPLRGRIQIARRYRWPTHVVDGNRVGATDVEVRTVVELRAGEDLVRVSVAFDHRCRDHRLRLHLPLPRPADGSEAGCAFTTVRRGLTAEGGPNEVGLPTFPARGFVRAGGLLVAHDGTPEYEVLTEGGAGRTLAVTLLRAVGVISQGPMATRALPAGPSTPTPAAQLPGPFRADLVLHTGTRDPYEVVDDAFTPLLPAHLPGARWGDPRRSDAALTVTGAPVSALTRRPDGRMELRVFNPTATVTQVAVAGRTGAVPDLGGEPTGEPFDGTTTLGPHRILTVALDEPG